MNSTPLMYFWDTSCHINQDRFEEGLDFYILYSFLVVAGVIGNILIFSAYHFWSQRVLGTRAPSAFLLRSLNILDLVTCALLFINLLTRHYESSLGNAREPPALGLFYSMRNVLIAYAMFNLALIALDRTLAVRSPFTTCWNVSRAKWTMFLFAAILGVSDLLVRAVIEFYPDKNVTCYTERIYNTLYGLAAVVLLIFTYVCYVLLFLSAYSYWRRVGRRRTETIVRDRTWTETVLTASSGLDTDSSIASNSNLSSSDYEHPVEPSPGAGAPASAHGGHVTFANSRQCLTDNSTTLPSTSEESAAQRRLIGILFTISVSHTMSIMPLFLYNAELIPFPGYSLYYFFYLNCFMNPFIYFVTREELRNYVVCIFRDPHTAFSHQGSVLP